MRPTSIRTLDPQGGPDVSVVGDTYRIVTSGAQTDGAYAIIDMLVPPGGGPGPHAHALIQESFYVMDGEVVVRSETQPYTARKGALVEIPKGGAIHKLQQQINYGSAPAVRGGAGRPRHVLYGNLPARGGRSVSAQAAPQSGRLEEAPGRCGPARPGSLSPDYLTK